MDKEKKYYVPDYEAGGYNEVNKEVFENFNSLRDRFMGNFAKGNKRLGKIIITSAPADTSTGDDFKRLWCTLDEPMMWKEATPEEAEQAKIAYDKWKESNSISDTTAPMYNDANKDIIRKLNK